MFNTERKAERELNPMRSDIDVIYYPAPTCLIKCIVSVGNKG